MRICLVSREISPFYGGGIGTYVAMMCRALADSGHDIHVLTASHTGLERAPALFPGVTFHTVALDGGAAAYPGTYATEHQQYAMGVYLTLRRLHALRPFDFVEFPDYGGEGFFTLRAKRTLGEFPEALLAVRLHTPTNECQQFNRISTLNTNTALVEYLEDTAILEADLVLSPTHSLLDLVRKRLGSRVGGQVVPYPYDMREVRALPARPPGVRPRVLYFGRLEHRKGVHLLIDAMQALFERGLDAEVQLIGGDTLTGPSNQSFKAWVERRIAHQWRDRFRFESSRPRAELASAIAEATVCCFPSIWENFPNVCLESMAAGALVVGSNAGGMAEIMEDGQSGLLFRSGDVAHLATTLERALGDAALRDALREAAPTRIATFCEPARIVKLLEGVLAEARAALPAPAAPKAPAPRGATPTVSFLVPYYNMGRYVQDTLRSIRAQTYKDYEIILVDDGSTDTYSRALLDTLDAPDLHVIRKQNGGLSSARNAALRHAKGRYVLPLDPDDVISPTFLEKAVAVLERSPGLGYVTSLVSYFTETPEQVVGGWVPWGIDRDALWVANVASTCTALMEKARVEEVGGYDEWLTAYEDWDVFCSLAERGYTGTVIPEFLFHYRVRPDSMTRTSLVKDRYPLMAYLYQKHPSLALHPERSLRILQGEAHKAQQLLTEAAQASASAAANVASAVNTAGAPGVRPLLDQVVDRVNDGLKRRLTFVHPLLRGAVRLVVDKDDPRPLRHQLVERFRRRGS